MRGQWILSLFFPFFAERRDLQWKGGPMPMAANARSASMPHNCGERLPGTAMTSNLTTELEAAAFRMLLQHLNAERTDVQNIDLMILAGFCRNCLADWYRQAALERGQTMSKEEAREHVYGEPFSQWKAKHQMEATPEQLAAFAAAQKRHG
jgi:hypothetical protein